MAIVHEKPAEKSPVLNERVIAGILANQFFDLRQQYCVVANPSWGLGLPWEADLMACTKAGFLTEVEIKVSLSDWKADIHKEKYRKNGTWMQSWWNLIKNYYYACPIELAHRHEEVRFPDTAGVLGIGWEKTRWTVEVIKPAVPNNEAKKLTLERMAKLARLGSMRAWGYNLFEEDKDGTDKA